MVKQFVTNLLGNNNSIVYKSPKKGQKSIRLTQQLIQSIFLKAKKLSTLPILILTIPANDKENYILTCRITKEKK